jgi:prefoldin subunit 5
MAKEVVNARRKEFEKTLPKGKTIEDAINEEVQSLKKYLIFLKKYVGTIFNTQKEIKTKIEYIKNKTKQNIKEEQLVRDLWILRYTLLHLWFFNFKPPEDQNDLTANISLINRAFQDVKGTSDYLPWLTKGFVEYAGTNQLKYSDLKGFAPHVEEKISEKIPLIVFECTEGRLGGELHDFVMELIMTMVVQDKKAFELSDDISLTKEEVENIKNAIDKMKPTKKDLEDFIDSISEDKEQNL